MRHKDFDVFCSVWNEVFFLFVALSYLSALVTFIKVFLWIFLSYLLRHQTTILPPSSFFYIIQITFKISFILMVFHGNKIELLSLIDFSNN